MNTFQITHDDGSQYITSANGTREEFEAYLMQYGGTVTTEKITLKQPAVVVGVNGVTALDKDNASHWTDTKFDGTTYTLDVDNTARGVPFTGVFLVAKEAGVSSNAFGCEYV